ncbi:Mediator of RNA polymerase II transcription subunit 24 [Oryzias melastigma]|uniref:Mediator of RNA polymerase II transcription subunit 24 n=1 Tax=Oryzias melastigma TaxID=30732 RepID=A0A834KXK6_ORYME|nr:Mediator of RNA polymerase II transcription subunit 24 [Oryzias melastigma]
MSFHHGAHVCRRLPANGRLRCAPRWKARSRFLTATCFPAKEPIRKALSSQFQTVLRKGWVDSQALHLFEGLLNMGGVFWFTNNLIKELLKETRREWANRAVELLYSIFCLDTQQITLTLLGTILPNLMTDSAHWHSLSDPPGKALAKLSVWCALSSYSSHHRGPLSARQRKRQKEDIEDYNSLFPLDDTQPSKLMRLLSSNEDEPVTLSSPGDRSMSSSLSASQLHTVNMRDPLNRVLANLFLLISSIVGSKMAGPHTQFVQSFIQECVECLEQGSRGSILQFMPFTMVSELVKLPALANPKVVLAITDLTLPLGRRVAAKAISAL